MDEQLQEFYTTLISDEEPIAKRMRTVFLLKQRNTNTAIDILIHGIPSTSILLGHECAYVLGQLQNKHALEALTYYLQNETIHPIVRHECAEAIANIGELTSLPLLESLCQDKCVEVAETCQIAVEKLKFLLKTQKQSEPADVVSVVELTLNESTQLPTHTSIYHSVDPAPSLPLSTPIEELREILNNSKLTFFDRYRAMFTLRDIGTTEAIDVLADVLMRDDEKSPVFRHEIAYIFGQMQHPQALKSLQRVLNNKSEHAMVRHEAAEAIGSIAEDECEEYLGALTKDDTAEQNGNATTTSTNTLAENASDDRIVRESVEVALDLCDYWNSDEVCTALTDENDGQEEEDEVIDMKKLRDF